MRGCCVTWGMGRHSPGNLLRYSPRQGVLAFWSALFPAPMDCTPNESAAIYGEIETSHCGSCVAVGCCVIVDHSLMLFEAW